MRNESHPPVQAAPLRSRQHRLETLADLLEQAIIDADANVKAQLAAQYRATLTELAALQPPASQQNKAVDTIDDLERAREKRRRKSAA